MVASESEGRSGRLTGLSCPSLRSRIFFPKPATKFFPERNFRVGDAPKLFLPALPEQHDHPPPAAGVEGTGHRRSDGASEEPEPDLGARPQTAGAMRDWDA